MFTIKELNTLKLEKIEKLQNHPHKVFKGIVMIRALLSLHGGTLEITLTVPLIYVLPNVICASFTPIKVFFFI